MASASHVLKSIERLPWVGLKESYIFNQPIDILLTFLSISMTNLNQVIPKPKESHVNSFFPLSS